MDLAQSLADQAGVGNLLDTAKALDGPDVGRLAKRLLAGELRLDEDLPRRLLRRFARLAREGLLGALAALAVPVLASLALRLATGREGGALTLVCRLGCACALARQCADAVDLAARALGAATEVARTAAPVLAAILTLTGAGASAAALTPISALCAGVIESALKGVGLPLCEIAAAVAAGGGLSDHFRLDGLFRLLRDGIVWGVRLLLGAFVALLAVEGRLAALQDTASSQTLGRALRGMIPFIGPSVSDSTGALLESAAAARATVGVTGLLAAAGVCARPVAALAAHALSLRLACAVIEPVADPGVVRIAAGFGEVARMLLALCVGGALLAALLSGTCLGLFGAG